PTSGVQTEIYEYGPEVGEDELAMLREKLHYLSGAVSTVVLAGSLPRKVPTELYAGMISDMTKRKVRTVIDCDGEPLRKALVAAQAAELRPEECLRRALACGAANSQTVGAGVFDPRDVSRFAGTVEVQEIKPAGTRAAS